MRKSRAKIISFDTRIYLIKIEHCGFYIGPVKLNYYRIGFFFNILNNTGNRFGTRYWTCTQDMQPPKDADTLNTTRTPFKKWMRNSDEAFTTLERTLYWTYFFKINTEFI